MSVPNTLTIYIYTNIPGSQFIKYTPSMTIPNNQNKNVWFDPLIQLNQNIIDKTPKNDIVTQFFDKNLFRTLIYRSESFQPYRTLKQATDEEIVDTNIQITLDNLFKSNSIFYINQKPYTISSCEWERGNWKIDTKIAEIPQTYKGQYGISTINYRNIMQSQLNQAQNELKALPPDVLEGPSFDSSALNPINPLVTPSTSPPITANPIPTPTPSPNNSLVPSQTPKQNQTTPTTPTTQTPPKQIQNPRQIQNPTPQKQIQNPTTQPLPQIQNPPNTITPPTETYSPTISISNVNTIALRKFFRQTNFASLVMTIYKNMTNNERIIVNQMIKNYTPRQTNVFNIASYNDSIKTLHIKNNNGGGNCFFIAVSDAINKYNDNSRNPITYLQYGTQKPFTQIVIRTIIANGILNNPESLNSTNQNAQASSNNMNTLFNDYVRNKGNITEDEFNQIIDDIYHEGDNSFVKKPNAMNASTLQNPFSAMTDPTEMQNYLLTNSWADERTIPILQEQLGLTVIPIQQVNNRYRIPFAYIQKNTNKALNNWNKYLFLFLSGNHFEEISFDFYTTRDEVKTKKSISIFEKDQQHIVPPFYILFLLFGSFYFPLDDSQKEASNILILYLYLNSINQSFDKIVGTANLDFITKFSRFFPSRKLDAIKRQIQSQTVPAIGSPAIGTPAIGTPAIGGALSTSPNKPQHFKNILDAKSNISYYITINLDLYPGTEIPVGEKLALSCRNTKNKLNKAWADFRGLKYSIQPHYYKTKNITQNNRPLNRTLKKR